MVKIGFKTTDVGYDGKDRLEFDIIEITGKDRFVNFSAQSIEKFTKRIKGKDVSFHSQVSRALTSKKKHLVEMEDDAIRSEILFCKHFKIKEFIFHLKQEKLTKKEELIVKKWLEFAKRNGVEMIYESNGKFKGSVCMDVLKRFPKLKYNLDLGHLNTAIVNKTLGMPLDEFLEKIKDRVIYLHAHNNDGTWDQHRGLNQGNLDWKYILDKLDVGKIRKIIMEVRIPKEIKETKKLLENYLKNKKWK